MKPCWEDEAKLVELHWSLPRSLAEYEDELHKIDYAFFYSISCPWTETDERLLYLGMTYKQNVWQRMKQHGLKKCEKAYPRKSKNLIISVATIEEANGNITKGLVTDIEALLIYSAWSDCDVWLGDMYAHQFRCQGLKPGRHRRDIPKKMQHIWP